MASIYFISLVAYGNEPSVHGCRYIHLSSSTPGTRKKCCVNGGLSSVSDNFDEDLMMDNVMYELPSFVRKIISSNSAKFSQKSSTYNILVAMAATVVCNSNMRLLDSHGMVQVHNCLYEWLCPSLYENCIKYITKLWYLLLHI